MFVNGKIHHPYLQAISQKKPKLQLSPEQNNSEYFKNQNNLSFIQNEEFQSYHQIKNSLDRVHTFKQDSLISLKQFMPAREQNKPHPFLMQTIKLQLNGVQQQNSLICQKQMSTQSEIDIRPTDTTLQFPQIKIEPRQNSQSTQKPPVYQEKSQYLKIKKLKNNTTQLKEQPVNYDPSDINKLNYFFRNHLSYLYTALGKKDLPSNISQKNQPKQRTVKKETIERLLRMVNTKTKYRFRQKLYLYLIPQLKTFFNMDVKARQDYFIRLKEQKKEQNQELTESESEEEAPKKKAKVINRQMYDMEYWKKYNNLDSDTKVFICKGNYYVLKQALEERGWIQNKDNKSPCFDLKWTCKTVDAYRTNLQEGQIVNHFRNNDSYTTKSGLSRNLRNLIQREIDIDQFFPKSYDLYDQADFEDFLEYKFTYAISQLLAIQQQNESELTVQQEIKIKTILEICTRKLYSIEKTINLALMQNRLITITKFEWDILNNDFNKIKDLQNYNEKLNSKFQISSSQVLKERIQGMISNLKEQDPQFALYGKNNIWIVKPARNLLILVLSRGRGIKLYNNIYKIIDHLLQRENTYVIQKYIEHPLIIQKRKFDIRQWILVTSWNPLIIWFYDKSYLRFSAQDYESTDIDNKFVHLTNNCIIKKHKDFNRSKIPGLMWNCTQFRDYLCSTTNRDIYSEKIKPAMQKLVITSLQSCNEQLDERQSSVELFGYDFIIDPDFNTWILEINKSPSMDTNTKITKDLVGRLQEDIIKVVVDYGLNKNYVKKNIDTGHFKCIYRQVK